MLEVVEYAKVVWRINIEEWVVRSGLIRVRVPPHLCVWVKACSMVKYHVYDYGDAALVTLIDKSLICLLGAIRLVGSKVVARVVAP
jgi:hypothetical protein